MSIKKWATRYISETGRRQVSLAIGEAEKYTSGEVVVVVAKSSTTVGHVPLMLTLILSLFGIVFQVPEWTWLYFSPADIFWPVLILVCYGISLPLSKIGWVQRFLTAKKDQAVQTFRRAQCEFHSARVSNTEKSTGVLIFVSLMEHKTIVLADKGIADRFSNTTWKEVCDLVVEGIKRNDLAGGLIEAIRLSGLHLKKEFPADPDNKNELTNELLIIE
ncbi:MAG: TPM domain-containing protein [Pseudobdellovibrionaceae bacterium]